MKKLYLVSLKGMRGGLGVGISYGSSYVIAENTDEAYRKLKKYLDEKDIGFRKDRVLSSVELVADEEGSNGSMILIDDNE